MKRFFWDKHSHTVIIWGILIFSFLVWWSTRNLPYHWDSAGFVINATDELVKRNFWPWVVEYSDFAHPPLLMTLLGIAWKLFGSHLWVSHIVMWPFLPILLISSFGLGQAIASDVKTRNSTGLGAVLIVASIPVILAEYGIIYIDLPSSALAIAALALAVRGRWILMAIALTVAALIKESALIIWPAIAYLGFYAYKLQTEDLPASSEKKKTLVKIGLCLLIPVIGWGVWVWYHQIQTGWWLIRPGRTSPQVPLGDSIASVMIRLLIEQGRIWGTAVGVIGGVIWLNGKKRSAPRIVIASLIYVGTSIMAFAWSREFAPRYGIAAMTAWAVIITWAIWEIAKLNKKFKGLIIIGLLALVICPQILNWYPKTQLSQTWEFSPSADLRYQDLIKIGQEAAIFLEKNYHQAQIYGAFPENYQLGQSIQGYVASPLNFAMCEEFSPNPGGQQIIYIHAYSPGQIDCMKILQNLGEEKVEILNRFESNGKWLELYLVKN